MLLIGVDVGGTFTDIVFTNTGTNQTRIHKVSSTPDDPARAVLIGVSEICAQAEVELGSVDHIYHGTTVATNAALQYRGAKTGMITTRGFRDIIHIGRHQRPQHYSINQEIPWQSRPLVKRRYRKIVTERLSPPHGEVVEVLAEDEVRIAAKELAEAGVESITICFLFSYLNPDHEKRAKAIVEEECPEIFVSCSHEVAPQFREFERFTTAAMNAFIGPLVRDYVTSLGASLEKSGFCGEMHIMCSNGGVASARTISKLPIYTLMSGLAAGVLAGAWVGRLAGRKDVITLDIGGTSADIGVVTDGKFAEASARDTHIASYPILAPMIDLYTIGAGGGSIAYLDQAGAFRVGPQSAGATPGPAAYGRGGLEATVTDANIVLGRIDEQNFLGGAMELDREAAVAAVQRLAKRLGMSLEEAAEGTIAILNANMANAIRARTVQKGIDPREYALVASGGGGPLQGAEVAKILDIPEVIVPPHPGINSAEGLLTTDLKHDIVRTSFQVSTNINLDWFNQSLDEMNSDLSKQLTSEEIDVSSATFERTADVRYVGQGYELRLPLSSSVIANSDLAAIFDEFHELHQKEYGHCFRDIPIEFVNLRVTAVSSVPKIGDPESPSDGSIEEAYLRTKSTIFRVGMELQAFETNFYDRSRLPVGQPFEGPAIILQTDSTTVVPPGSSAQIQSNGCLVITIDSD